MKERVLFVRDSSYEREDANPLDAVLVFLTSPHADPDTDMRVALTGLTVRCSMIDLS